MGRGLLGYNAGMSRLVYGLRPVEELLKSGREVAMLYVAEGERSEQISQIYLARAQPGQSLKVKVDPNDNTAVWIDWITPA